MHPARLGWVPHRAHQPGSPWLGTPLHPPSRFHLGTLRTQGNGPLMFPQSSQYLLMMFPKCSCVPQVVPQLGRYIWSTKFSSTDITDRIFCKPEIALLMGGDLSESEICHYNRQIQESNILCILDLRIWAEQQKHTTPTPPPPFSPVSPKPNKP